MIIGDPQQWKDRFVTLDERLLARVLYVWPTCVAVLSGQPDEDAITINLVALLSNDSVVRRICYLPLYQHEPFGTRPGGAKFSKGRIDIAFLLDQERERYIAYECKRLNVANNGTRSSLATRYVKDGMMRFLTEQYAEGLPVGCMLGYVMDGDLPFALAQVNAAMAAQSASLNMAGDAAPSQAVSGIERFATVHERASKSVIELRHVLLPFAVIKGSGTTSVRAAAIAE